MDALTSIVRKFLSRETFFIVGNLLSIASFVLTIFVLLNLRKLRNTYKLRVRGPSLIKDLSKCASNLSGLMDDYNESLPQITEELGKGNCETTVHETETEWRCKKVRQTCDCKH